MTHPRKAIIVILIFFCFVPVFSHDQVNNITLSDKAEITLLTSSPGEELYSVFGHSALRVNDPVNDIDRAYNYGTFDFDTDNFYYKFAKGRLLYKLSVGPYNHYEAEYRFEGRSIHEQVLNLNPREKQRIYAFLEKNALPENRYYNYDFFYDNCATRIRDLVDKLVLVEWYAEPYEVDYRSFRDLLEPYLEDMPWNQFGIDVILGLSADKIATPYEHMFLPDEMFLAFASARMVNGSPLVSQERLLLEKTRSPEPPHPLTPNIVCWLVLVIGLTSFFNKKTNKVFDMVFFTVLSLLGLIIIFLWFVSEHTATNSNMNLLWALPTHIYFFFKCHFQTIDRFSRWYFKLVMVISVLMILLWQWIPQDFNTAFFPIILLVLIKSIPPALKIDVTNIIRSRRFFKKSKSKQH